MFHVKHSLATVLVLLAAGTGLLWPKSNISAEAQYFDAVPVPVRTLTYRQETPPPDAGPLWLPRWLGAEDAPTPPAWRLRSDGLWVPWVMDPPAWLTTIAGSYVVAEAVPLPPERPKDKTTPTPETGTVLSSQKRIARKADVCAQHGLTKTYTDKYRWRCR